MPETKGTATKQSTPKKPDNRFRNFAFMLYDDSASPTWKEDLDSMHIPYFWIFHDKDTNPNGEPKKPHYHLIIMFEGKKSDNQVQEIANKLGVANGKVEVINSIRGYARYLCHMDNPEKHQYDSSLVRAGGGADYSNIIGLPSDKYKSISEMIDFCKTENIISYAELLEYAQIHKNEWFKTLCDNGTMVMKEYLKSREWEEKRLNEKSHFEREYKLEQQNRSDVL
jgi:Plasmid replication protein.